MEITLSTPKKIIIQAEVSVNEKVIKVLSVTDTFGSVNAMVQLGDTMPIAYVLWEGEAYENIGQWTDSDVEKRILELI